jgi:hypothetical protein
MSGLLGRLGQGVVLCAEGYLFELERRGYLKAGAYVPEEGGDGSRRRRSGALPHD